LRRTKVLPHTISLGKWKRKDEQKSRGPSPILGLRIRPSLHNRCACKWLDFVYNPLNYEEIGVIMKIDPHKHKERYFKWKESLKDGIINDLSKENSSLILKYLQDMENGI